MPTSRIAAISRDVAMGCRMKGRDGLISDLPAEDSAEMCLAWWCCFLAALVGFELLPDWSAEFASGSRCRQVFEPKLLSRLEACRIHRSRVSRPALRP